MATCGRHDAWLAYFGVNAWLRLKWLVDMPEMDDGSIIAQIERRLAKEDPELASTMKALNLQFSVDSQPVPCSDFAADEEECMWWVTAASVLVIIAFLSLFVFAALTGEAQGSYVEPGSLRGTGVGTQGER